MTVVSGAQWTGMIATKDATGALSAATVGPVGVLYVNGVVSGAGVAIAGANPYTWTVTLPALADGDCVSMYITATIALVATAGVVAEDVASTVYLSSRSTLTQADILSDATPFPGAHLDAPISGAAVPGDAMALTPAERATLAGVVDGELSGAHGAGSWEGGGATPTEIWEHTDRSLTSFGTLVADVAAAVATTVWGALATTLTTAGSIGKYLVDYLAAIRAKTNLLGTTTLAYAGPVLPNGNVQVIQGDAYEDVDGLRLEWTDPGWNIDESATLLVVLQNKTFLTATWIDAQTIGRDLSSADTDALTVGRGDFYVVEIRSATKRITRQRGTWETLPKPDPTE